MGAGLLARTVYNLQRADLSFPAERVLLVRVGCARPASRARRSGLLRELAGQIRRFWRARGGFSQLGVFSGGVLGTIEVEGYAEGDDDRDSALDAIGPG
jgi:hypothetical protein